jgi:hypothetical protein
MSAESAVISLGKPKAYQAILFAGLTVGVLDISSAFINSGLRGTGPIRVLQGIASGLLGADAYNDGVPAAALGLGLHFLVAFVATTIYYFASRKLTFMVQQPIISGALYGVAVYMFMYLVVLPLTFHRSFVTSFSTVLTAVLIHIFCVGLPMALVIRQFSK